MSRPWGRLDEARLAFEIILTYANHVGLFYEQIALTGESATSRGRSPAERPSVTSALERFAWGTRRYLLVTTVFGFIVAALDTIALAITGVPLAVTWGCWCCCPVDRI